MRQLAILLVEDNDDDAMLLMRAVRKAGMVSAVARVHNGQEAMDYLEGTGAFADRQHFPMPDMILLDLKMPGVSGFEFLQWLRAREPFRSLPVVALTGSEIHPRAGELKRLGVERLVIKTARYEHLADELRSFCERTGKC